MSTLHGFRRFTDSVVVSAAVVGAAAIAAFAVSGLSSAAPIRDRTVSPADLGAMVVTAQRLPEAQPFADLGSLLVVGERARGQVANLGQLTVTARRAPLVVAEAGTADLGGNGSQSWE